MASKIFVLCVVLFFAQHSFGQAVAQLGLSNATSQQQNKSGLENKDHAQQHLIKNESTAANETIVEKSTAIVTTPDGLVVVPHPSMQPRPSPKKMHAALAVNGNVALPANLPDNK